jgi:hypothetical protein
MIKDLKVHITGYVDDWQPGWVKCVFTDAYGIEWSIIEKVPVVSAADLNAETRYPVETTIQCEVINEAADIVTINLDKPWGISEQGGRTIFEVFEDQLTTSNYTLPI